MCPRLLQISGGDGRLGEDDPAIAIVGIERDRLTQGRERFVLPALLEQVIVDAPEFRRRLVVVSHLGESPRGRGTGVEISRVH